MNDRMFVVVGSAAALAFGALGIYLWGLILGWWSW